MSEFASVCLFLTVNDLFLGFFRTPLVGMNNQPEDDTLRSEGGGEMIKLLLTISRTDRLILKDIVQPLSRGKTGPETQLHL